MKGIVFNSFVSFIEENYGLDFLNYLEEKTGPESEFAYTTIGNYSSSEIVNCLIVMSEESGRSVNDITINFGQYLFQSLAKAHNKFIEKYDNAIPCLYALENEIHKQVRKMYQNTSLPSFDVHLNDEGDELSMLYLSKRPMADLAEGLIAGCIEHYGNSCKVVREDKEPFNGTHALFTITNI
ncbi:heme NO-binding domain-containing protein [Kangiella sp. HZ709]|uniref:heme NO-binding domain-containing protein n=1 Tax=Kangiella sp. HZ709 TaxID=2666328 RepID=UPI0012AFF479|nr:heme NO-binding domain-containing protein [Kangiella sp. HZ709]MRX27259.1 hypothetical protein [Kangiella sp. HZ709]